MIILISIFTYLTQRCACYWTLWLMYVGTNLRGKLLFSSFLFLHGITFTWMQPTERRRKKKNSYQNCLVKRKFQQNSIKSQKIFSFFSILQFVKNPFSSLNPCDIKHTERFELGNYLKFHKNSKHAFEKTIMGFLSPFYNHVQKNSLGWMVHSIDPRDTYILIMGVISRSKINSNTKFRLMSSNNLYSLLRNQWIIIFCPWLYQIYRSTRMPQSAISFWSVLKAD